jgi:hypothetical protein
MVLRDSLERVEFVVVQDGHRALADLEGIQSDVMMMSSSNGGVSNLVIFDSTLGCLSSDLFADGDGGIVAELVEDVGFALKKTARSIGASSRSSSNNRSRCAVFVVNGALSADYGHNAALGTGWRAADIQFRLDVIQDDFQPEREQQQFPDLTVATKRVVAASLMKHSAKAVMAREDPSSTRRATVATVRQMALPMKISA